MSGRPWRSEKVCGLDWKHGSEKRGCCFICNIWYVCEGIDSLGVSGLGGRTRIEAKVAVDRGTEMVVEFGHHCWTNSRVMMWVPVVVSSLHVYFYFFVFFFFRKLSVR